MAASVSRSISQTLKGHASLRSSTLSINSRSAALDSVRASKAVAEPAGFNGRSLKRAQPLIDRLKKVKSISGMNRCMVLHFNRVG